MNLKVRIKNPVFWIQIFGTVAATILGYFGMSGTDVTSWPLLFDTLGKALANPYVLFIVATGIWNALNDPTTKGIQDSERAKSYVKPN